MSENHNVDIRVSAEILDARERPPIFDERNRFLWDAVRRLLIFILRELDKWYGWSTFRH